MAGLHNAIERVAPVVADSSPYGATYTLNLMTASGTACLFAAIVSAFVLRMSVAQFLKTIAATARQLGFSILTVAAVLGLTFLMNYSGATVTLGLAFAATGALFPFFSALLGWVGVFLTGSDTSGGVMGKMISLQSIAVAAAATGMPSSDEPKLFRFTLKHSILLASVLGLVVVFYAYVMPEWVR
jgi:lactate permease